jgi:hypothetical protein
MPTCAPLREIEGCLGESGGDTMTAEVDGEDIEFFERRAPSLGASKSPGEMVAPAPRSTNKLESDNQLHIPLWFLACNHQIKKMCHAQQLGTK